jgi:hypothetical protein
MRRRRFKVGRVVVLNDHAMLIQTGRGGGGDSNSVELLF